MSSKPMTVTDVANLVQIARSTAPRSRGDAYRLVVACDRRLAQAGQLKDADRADEFLAADVRLPFEAVVAQLWKLRKVALAQWKAARAEDLRAAEAAFVAAE